MFRSLILASPWRLGEGPLRKAKKGSTVGRRCDLQWVALTTYSSFFRRPTVGLFLGVLKERAQVLRKRGGSTQEKGHLSAVERRVVSSLVLFLLVGIKGRGICEVLGWVVGVD